MGVVNNSNRGGVAGAGAGPRVNSELYCGVCQNKFQSRNKLFQHLKDTGHTVQLGPGAGSSFQTAASSAAQGKRRKKKK